MKKKKTIILPIIIIILLVILIGIGLFIKNLKEDSNQNNLVMEEIKNDYNILEENIKEYNNIRTTLTNYLENSYTEKLASEYNEITELLTRLDNNIKLDQESTKKLDNNCQSQLFLENKVNTICATYQEYYEKLVNVYLNDIKTFNYRVSLYNETKEEKLEEYIPTYVKDYIDYNKDGVYSEREES